MKEENKENGLIIYQDDNGSVKVNVRFSDEDVWLTQAQLAEIYATTQQNIAQHIKNIYAEDELEAEATHKKFLLVRQEGARSVRRWQRSVCTNISKKVLQWTTICYTSD